MSPSPRRQPTFARRAALTMMSASLATIATASSEVSAQPADPIAQDINVSGPFLQDRTDDPHDPGGTARCGEPQIMQDATDPQVLVMACMTLAGLNYQTPAPATYLTWQYTDPQVTTTLDQPCYTFISRDGGTTWDMIQPHPLKTEIIVGCADPMAERGPQGELYLGGDGIHVPARGIHAPVITREEWPNPREPLGIVFTRSTDSGRSWSDPIILPTANNRPEWIVDQSTGVFFNVSGCATFDPVTRMGTFGCTPESSNLAVSTDQGRTWTPMVSPFNTSPPVKERTQGLLHDIGFGGGSHKLAAANGVFVFAGTQAETAGSGAQGSEAVRHTVQFKYSTDNGATFTQRPIPLGEDLPCENPTVAGAAGNPTKRGSFAVLVLCAPNAREARIFLTDDLGETWRETARLADTPPPDYKGNASAFGITRPWMDYSPSGVLGVMWRQNYGIGPFRPMGNTQPGPQDVYVAFSLDGGTSFGEVIRINTAASPPPDPRMFFGDDISDIILDDDYAYVVWGDWRSGELQSWFRKIPLRGANP